VKPSDGRLPRSPDLRPPEPRKSDPRPSAGDLPLRKSSDPRMPRPIEPRSSAGSDPRLPIKPSSEPRLQKAADGRPAPSRGTPSPILVRGEPPTEPILVSVVTTSQDALEYTHAFVAAYCRQRFRASVGEALTTAAHELLENAINYGSVSGQVLFEIVERTGSAAVRVTNETIPARLDMLRTHVEKLTANPEAVMMEEMKRSMGMSRTRPMLGLARVVQEAGLGLELYILGARVTVLARAGT
jgi:anti-sigma regulatory factor (Ser/Thr protein kinase)